MAQEDDFEDEEIAEAPVDLRKPKGLFSSYVRYVHPLAEGEKGAATAWGAVWRTCVLVVLYAGAWALQAAASMWEIGDLSQPGALYLAGITWDSWWGSIIIILTFFIGVLSPVLMGFLYAFCDDLRRWPVRIATAVCTVCLVLTFGVFGGNMTGESLFWIEGSREGVYGSEALSSFLVQHGITSMLPGVAAVAVCTMLGVVLWLIASRVQRQETRGGGLLTRLACILSPAACLVAASLLHVLPLGVRSVPIYMAGIVLLLVLYGQVLPNDLSAAAWAIKTRRPASCLWAFAISLVWELLSGAHLLIGLMYQM